MNTRVPTSLLTRGARRNLPATHAIVPGQPLDDAHVDSIVRSHERCATIGLSRVETPDYAPAGRSDLGEIRERNRRLYAHAAPVMEMLFDQVVTTQSMVVLTDPCGTIIHSIGDADFLARASKVALTPGVNWSEPARGTNAIGTALVSEQATFVHADEHFMHANHFLTCAAALIFDPRGNILGVLDVTGDQRRYHQHTMGLVKMSARMIENHWLTDDSSHVLRLHLHSRSEFLGTLMEGILAVNRDGRIVGANRSALDHLGLSGPAARAHSVTSLFGISVSMLVDHFRSPLPTPISVALPNGSTCYLQARFNWVSWYNLGGIGGVPATPTAATADVAGGTPAAEVEPMSQRPAEQAETLNALVPAGADARRHEGLASLDTGDAQMRLAIEKVRRVIDRDIPILVLGETGTGKELMARAIHQESRRARQPFVAVNCASIPDTLIEAELFGYEEGAFTGARRRGAVGKIVQAHGGTLFLDEVGDMPLPLQARLLRVLQERQVTPLGSSKSVPVDVMIVSATHRNLRGMIAEHQFREDLYYRLNGLLVKLPPLRERSDLLRLVQTILQAQPHGTSLRLADDVAQRFCGYHWPGNVRQLTNVLRTAAVMASGDRRPGGLVTCEHLPDDFLEETMQPGPAAGAAAPSASMATAPASAYGSMGGPAAVPFPAGAARGAAEGMVVPPGAAACDAGSVANDAPADAPMARTLQAAEIEMIRAAVKAAGGNVSAASKQLGIARNTIYRKLQWKIER